MAFYVKLPKDQLQFKFGSLLYGGYVTSQYLYEASSRQVFRVREARARDSYLACIGRVLSTLPTNMDILYCGKDVPCCHTINKVYDKNDI